MKKFKINVEMEEKFIPAFLSMLGDLQETSESDKTKIVSFYASGKNFKANFNTDVEYEKVSPKPIKEYPITEIYDAEETICYDYYDYCECEDK